MQGIYNQKHQSQQELLFLHINKVFFLLKIEMAKLVCHLIPASCPFARDLLLFGYEIQIPPLCKLNPAYNYFMNLRWQSLSFLAETNIEQV